MPSENKFRPKRRHGRHRLEPAQRLDALLAFNVIAADRESVYRHCDKLGVVPAAWMRELVMAAVKAGARS